MIECGITVVGSVRQHRSSLEWGAPALDSLLCVLPLNWRALVARISTPTAHGEVLDLADASGFPRHDTLPLTNPFEGLSKLDAHIPIELALFAALFLLVIGSLYHLDRRSEPPVRNDHHNQRLEFDDAVSIQLDLVRECRSLLGSTTAELLNAYAVVAKIANSSPLQRTLNRELDTIRGKLGLAPALQPLPNAPITWEQLRTQLRSTVEEVQRIAGIAEAAVSATYAPAELGRVISSELEAYAFLGVHSGASPAAMKKTIDGLRQCWHPDLAANEEDRRFREVRIRQINAAWDLIRPKKAGA